MDIIETFCSFVDDDNWQGHLKVSDNFFNTINKSTPIFFDAFKALSSSPLAMDIYCWITRKMYVLNRFSRAKEEISWEEVKKRFGGFSNKT